MPEVNLNMGDRIKQRVRDFFEMGHKSGNKQYAVKINGTKDQPLWNAVQWKAIERRWHAREAQNLRLGWPGSYHDLARDLVRVPMEDRSGNCGEQADGKRVSWHAGSQGPGWYPPGGEYKNVFALAPVQILPF